MAEHVVHLREALLRLRRAGLVLNVAKCVFARDSVEFLGHKVDTTGIRPLADKVKALRDHCRPTTVKELQQFLGLLNFYRKFLPAAACLLAPLYGALQGSPAGSTKLSRSTAMESAFYRAKAGLSSTVELAHRSSTAELALVADASSSHVGVALQQHCSVRASWEPLGFFSHKLDAAQIKYSAFDRELPAAFSTVRHFRFQLRVDHSSCGARPFSDAWTPRQQRHLSFIAEYTNDIRFVPGVENVVADTLSRPPAAWVELPLAAPTPVRSQRPASPDSSASPAAVPPAAPAPVRSRHVSRSQPAPPASARSQRPSSLAAPRPLPEISPSSSRAWRPQAVSR